MKNEKNILDHLKVREIPTPDSTYFEQLAENIASSQKTKVVKLYKRPLFWMSAAAAAIIISLAIVNIGNNPIDNESFQLSMNELSHNEIMDYVDEHIDEFDTELLYEIIPDDSLEVIDEITFEVEETNELEPEVNSTMDFDDIDSDDILNYLEYEGLNIEELNEDETIFINLQP